MSWHTGFRLAWGVGTARGPIRDWKTNERRCPFASCVLFVVNRGLGKSAGARYNGHRGAPVHGRRTKAGRSTHRKRIAR